MDYHAKYLIYKKKYLMLKQSQLTGSGEISEPITAVESTGNLDALMTPRELFDAYDNHYKFYDLRRKNARNINILMDYIYSKFGPFKQKIDANRVLSNKISDAEFYQILRKDYTNDLDKIIKFQKNLYKTKHVVQKTKSIMNVVNSNLKSFQCQKILDIGTEDVDFLLELEKNSGCNVTGLNIRSGYSHYNTYEEAIKSKKIVLYDGYTIPFNDNEFSLITVIAVLHHVENIEKFIKEICRVGEMVYIKDNDMTNISSRYNVDIQHELYEGVLYPSKLSPLYITTNNQIVDLLEKNNFEIIYNKVNNYFTRPYTILASKKSI